MLPEGLKQAEMGGNVIKNWYVHNALLQAKAFPQVMGTF